MLFGALAASSPVMDSPVVLPLAALAIVQVLEPKIPALAQPRGRVIWILLKLALCYLVIGFTGSIDSNFWLLLMLPVVSAATALGLGGTILFTAVAAAAYLSFLLFPDWSVVARVWPDCSLPVVRVRGPLPVREPVTLL